MTWERGRAEIERLIRDGELDRVAVSNEVAARLLADTDAHIALASKGFADDPAGALQLGYDAARKAAAALLAVQGLRGVEIGILGAVAAPAQRVQATEDLHAAAVVELRPDCVDDGHVAAPRRRPGVNEDDARQAIETARAVVNAAKRLIDSGRLDPFEGAQ